MPSSSSCFFVRMQSRHQSAPNMVMVESEGEEVMPPFSPERPGRAPDAGSSPDRAKPGAGRAYPQGWLNAPHGVQVRVERCAAMLLSIVVPTFNEAPNIEELVRRVASAVDGAGIEAEIVFVDDSTDATPDVIREVAARVAAERAEAAASTVLPVRLIH